MVDLQGKDLDVEKRIQHLKIKKGFGAFRGF